MKSAAFLIGFVAVSVTGCMLEQGFLVARVELRLYDSTTMEMIKNATVKVLDECGNQIRFPYCKVEKMRPNEFGICMGVRFGTRCYDSFWKELTIGLRGVKTRFSFSTYRIVINAPGYRSYELTFPEDFAEFYDDFSNGCCRFLYRRDVFLPKSSVSQLRICRHHNDPTTCDKRVFEKTCRENAKAKCLQNVGPIPEGAR